MTSKMETYVPFNYDSSTGNQISQLFAKSKAYLSSRFRVFNVTTEQWAILNRLWREDGISQSLLAERCDKDLPTVTRIVKILKDKEFGSGFEGPR